jgi:formyl-CoA transferase
VNIAASSSAQFERFCEAIERPDWPQDPRWSSTRRRTENRLSINAAIAEVTREKPSEYWVERLEAAGIPCGPILAVDQVFADPQVRHIGVARTIESAGHGRQELVGQAVDLSRTPWELRTPTPEKGEHTDAVLSALGYDATAIAGLRARGAI